jgi:Na+/H+ antiporter
MRIKRNSNGKINGWLALSPLLVFLVIYLVSSLIAKDFYTVPVTAAFMLSSVYSVLITPGKIADRIALYSQGAGNKNVLMMIWIFIMAGAFASTAKAIGSVEATVNLTLMILPGKFILAGLFIASCFISMSIGTSVGTIVALVPIAAGIAGQADLSMPMTTALIVGGAFFGDNLSFISDTTIAATTTQGCSMSDKFKTNIWIAGPAALAVAVIYIVIGLNADITPEIGEVSLLKLIPYLCVIIMALWGVNVLVVLSIGLGLCAIIGFAEGMTWTSFLGSIGSGIGGMGELIIVTMLAGGMLETIRHNGGIKFIIERLTRKVSGKKGAEAAVGGLVALSNFCTANNTIAILTVGKIAREVSERYGIDPRKTASILDTFSCVIQGIIPYGAQLLMASSLAEIPATEIIPWLFYPMILFVTACLSILLGFPKMKPIKDDTSI